MIDDLTLIVGRQCEAALVLEGRLRAVELLIQAGEQRFLGMAVDEVEAAADRLAALELARTLALNAIGAPDDVTAEDIVSSLAAERVDAFARRATELRQAVGRITVRRERVRHLIEETRAEGRHRLAAIGVA